MGILRNNGPIDQLTEGVKLDRRQAILEFTAKPLPEARLFLLISVHVIPGISGVRSIRVKYRSIRMLKRPLIRENLNVIQTSVPGG
jgi:hypothetical protein